jgi:hypothetical protein
MTHWAAKFIGIAWTPTQHCWWLIREACRDRWGIDMPDIGVGDIQMADNAASIKSAAEAGGWRRVDDPPSDGDILLCRDVIGKRHVGMVICSQARLRLLHSDGHMTDHGPVGAVVAPPLGEALRDLREVELWRRA